MIDHPELTKKGLHCLPSLIIKKGRKMISHSSRELSYKKSDPLYLNISEIA